MSYKSELHDYEVSSNTSRELTGHYDDIYGEGINIKFPYAQFPMAPETGYDLFQITGEEVW